MADEGGEKTEMPTPKKLRDARQKGQVCTSKDVVSTAILLVMLSLAGVLAIALSRDIAGLIAFIGLRIGENDLFSVREAGKLAIIAVFKYSFIFVLIAAAVGVAANLVQTGFLFSFEPVKPDLKKLNPVQGAKKIFSKKNLFELFKNILKVSFLGYLIFKIIMASVPALLPMCYGSIDNVFDSLGSIMKGLAFYTIFGYVVIAVIDRLFQQKNFTKEMMMTKDEVKREYKEMEGSQEIKQAQRQFRDEILSGEPPQIAVKKADVIVTNPTHIAVGIRYRHEEAPLPKVVVSGADTVAREIRYHAMREGIPIMENVPLARALYGKVKIEEFIPVELVEPVAEVLKWVKALNEAEKEDRELESVDL